MFKVRYAAMIRISILNTSCLIVLGAGLLSYTIGFAATPVATLAKTQGMVMIDRGDGFAIAASGDGVVEGDQILVMENSSGELVSGDCKVNLSSNARYHVGSQGAYQTGCHSDAFSGVSTGTLYAAAIGVVKPRTKADDIEKPPADTGTETTDSTEPDQVANQTPDSQSAPDEAHPKISSQAIIIGAGVAAALALIAGGGNSSTTSH